MQYITVNTIDGKQMKLSKFILGGSFGRETPEEETFALIDRFRELGGNAIDTARAYGGIDDQLSFGRCEARFGEYIRSRNCRDELYIITKGGFPALYPDFSFKRWRITREAILGDFYTSYDNLRIGPIDLYLLHRDDPEKPVSYIMDILNEIVRSGDVRAIGVSNWSLDRVLEANAYAESIGMPKLVINEIQWGYAYLNNEMREDPSVSIMNPEMHRQYEAHGIPIISFTSQDSGLWIYLYSGKETWDTLKPSRKMYDCPVNRKKFEKVKEYCDKHSVSPAALVTAYLACNKVTCGPIIGCHTMQQLEDSMSGASLLLDQATIDWMDDVQ